MVETLSYTPRAKSQDLGYSFSIRHGLPSTDSEYRFLRMEIYYGRTVNGDTELARWKDLVKQHPSYAEKAVQMQKDLLQESRRFNGTNMRFQRYAHDPVVIQWQRDITNGVKSEWYGAKVIEMPIDVNSCKIISKLCKHDLTDRSSPMSYVQVLHFDLGAKHIVQNMCTPNHFNIKTKPENDTWFR